ncbi:uncharacterized protein LOC119683559 [Teleopsis dalmanni]|uniref:uncharacterized protein LOC119683559 n=1 Tax=Teleopsis dalmanni TaxID=139649 RepID=UPI0018CE0240|nr:uncharacterized protein LOC119683559 [Teleopsis dalmanni]XP_037953203.1 uncharacterized protein LOC119683559 [Teleopsis dalmanni]
MKSSIVRAYAFRLKLGQSSQLSTQASNAAASSSSSAFVSTTPDRIVTRSATMMAIVGIGLSSFSLKQMLSNNNGPKPRLLGSKY